MVHNKWWVSTFATGFPLISGDKIYWQNVSNLKCGLDSIHEIKVSLVCPIIALTGFFTTTQKILFICICLIFSDLCCYKGREEAGCSFLKTNKLKAKNQEIKVVDT
jgi:hypothetical protein